MHPSNLIRSRLGSDFERAVYDAALKSFNQLDNPLRVNNYATALRELGRIHLEAQAPDERIKQCAWFEQKYNELNKPVIERAQRVKYAVQGELEDEFVVETLGIEIEETVKAYTSLVSRLSSFTHITAKKFDLSTEEADKLAKEATEVFEKLFRLIEERRDETRKAAESEAQDALQDVLYGEVNEELDRLSTHSSVTGVDLYGLTIVSMDSKKIKFSGHGNVDVRLQYGSDSDVRRDDGAVSRDSYPLTCDFEADTCTPLDISVVPGTLVVDTISFYEPQLEEYENEESTEEE
jgi:hypothetical protein